MVLSSKNRLIVSILIYLFLLISFSSFAYEPATGYSDLQIRDYRHIDGTYSLSWEWPDGLTPPDNLLIVYSEGEPISISPSDGQEYATNSSFGNGTVLLQNAAQSSGGFPFEGYSFPSSTLPLEATNYWITIYPYNGSGTEADYHITDPAELSFVTTGIVEEPYMQATFQSASVGDLVEGSHDVTINFDPSPYSLYEPFETRYLMIANPDEAISYIPQDGVIPWSLTDIISFNDGSSGRLDYAQGTNEVWTVPATAEEQTVYFQIYVLNKVMEDFAFDYNESIESTNYLLEDPISFQVTIPAKPNSSPEIAEQSFSLDENPLVNDEIGTVVATDPDEDELSYSLEEEASSFVSIDETSGVLTVVDPDYFDFETYSSQVFNVTVTDAYEASSTAQITININNSNDNAPIMGDYIFSIDENSPDGFSVGTVSSTDADGEDVTYTITAGNADEGFAIDGNTGEITVATPSVIDYESTTSFELTVEASDGLNSGTGQVTINLNDLDDSTAPVFSDQSFTIIESIENGNQVGQLVASDPSQLDLTFSIVSGNDDEAIALDSETGELSINDRTTIDFDEASLDLIVEANNGTEATEATISIVLNSAPIFGFESFIFSQDENDFWSISIPISDAEGDSFSVVISDGAGEDLVQIVESDGSYSLTPSSSEGIDFETTESIEAILEATDEAGNVTQSETITIEIINLNDNTPETENASININEFLPTGTEILTVAGTDLDGDVLSFELSEGNVDDAFSISSNTGVISVNTSEALNFEVTPAFELAVQVSDGTFSTNATISININEEAVNTAPRVDAHTFSIEENSEIGTLVGTVIAIDFEGDDLSYSLEGGNVGSTFSIDAVSGELSVAENTMLDFETNESFVLIVAVSDGDLDATAIVTIELIDIEESEVMNIDQTGAPSISIYPNPTSSYFSLTQNEDVKSIRVWSESGKLLAILTQDPGNQYSVEHLPTGLYILSVESNDTFHNNRLVVK